MPDQYATMRFLHVVQLYHPVASGAARYFAEVGERLVRKGHHVTVLTMPTTSSSSGMRVSAASRCLSKPTTAESCACRCGACPARQSPTQSCAA